MITAPSEIRKATGMLPFAGGLSGFASVRGSSLYAAHHTAAEAARENGIAATNPNAADPCSSSLLFILSLLCVMSVQLLAHKAGSCFGFTPSAKPPAGPLVRPGAQV